MNWGCNPEPNGNECNCCITIDAGCVLIICSEIDAAALCDSLQALVKTKDSKNLENQE